MPMLDPRDNMFAARLERQIRLILGGDGKNPGLYQTILASPTWDDFNRARAQIVAYETVLRIMQETAKNMDEPEEPKYSDNQPRAH